VSHWTRTTSSAIGARPSSNRDHYHPSDGSTAL
jgi:hypothetical protein